MERALNIQRSRYGEVDIRRDRDVDGVKVLRQVDVEDVETLKYWKVDIHGGGAGED